MYLKCSLFLIFPINSISAFNKSSSHWPCSQWDDTGCQSPSWPLQLPKPALLPGWRQKHRHGWWGSCPDGSRLCRCLAPRSCWPLLSQDTTLLGDSTRISGRHFAAVALDENFIISFYSFHYFLLKLLLGLHSTSFYIYIVKIYQGFHFLYVCSTF